MDIETLIKDYLGCNVNKKRSADSVIFELHWERDLVRLKDDYDTRSLVPFLYSFVKPRPRPREVNANRMEGKIPQYFFDRLVRPEVEKRLTDRTFNNRKGYGPDKAIARLMQDIWEVSEGFTRDCYVIERDIQSYFPSSDQDRTYKRYRALIEENFPEGEERDDLLYVLQRVTYSYPNLHTHLLSPKEKWDPIIKEGKSVIFNCEPGKGACLGNQFWQVEKNDDLSAFDYFNVVICGLHYVRYVDDMVWVVQNKEAGLAHVALCENMLLEDYGYRMHPKKRSCQHYSKGGNFIGIWFKFDRTYIGNRVVRHAKESVREWNRKANPSQLEHFLQSINSYFGLMKHHYAYGIIKGIVEDHVSEKWKKYCTFNEERRCFQAKPGYTHNELLMRKYNFTLHKTKRHDKTRNSRPSQREGVPNAGTPADHGGFRSSRKQMQKARGELRSHLS